MKHLIIFIFILSSILACKKKTNETKVYKWSEDICYACTNSTYYIIGEDTILIPSIITPNGDGFNDLFKIKYRDTIISSLPINLTIFDRDGRQIVHFDNYKNSWPTYSNIFNGQDTDGLTNGLYKYVLKIGSDQLEGYFIILLKQDAYMDKTYLELPCHKCIIIDAADPLLI